MNKILLTVAALVTTPLIHAQSTWTGTINNNSVTPGSFDYSVNTVTDTMTISNRQGYFASTYGSSITTTLYATNDFSTGTNNLTPTGPTYDVTDAHFLTSTRAGLGAVENDGWYWLSPTKDSFFHLIIGAVANGSTGALLDWNTSQGQVMSISTATYATHSGEIKWDDATATPEPSSTALLGLGALGLLVRRKRN